MIGPNKGRVFGLVACILIGSLGSVIVGCAKPEVRYVAPVPEGSRADREKVVAEIMKKEKRDEFDEMVLVTDMEGQQLGAFLDAVADRHAKFKAWQAGPKGRKLAQLRASLAEARKARDDEKIGRINKQIEPLDKEHWDYRTGLRADVVSVMTLEQQRTWASHILYGVMMGRHFGRAGLADAQKQKMRDVCDQMVAKHIKAPTMRKDPYLWRLRRGDEPIRVKTAQTIKKKVLTDAQRERM